MTDRELLELAAKAAGIAGEVYEVNGRLLVTAAAPEQSFSNTWFPEPPWQPLTDDGDALRLAVKLRIHTCIHPDTIVPSRGVRWKDGSADCSLWEPEGDNPCAATRRAIVRAAAEIGKEKSK